MRRWAAPAVRLLVECGQDGGMHVVAAPDKFRGTATAAEVAEAIGRAVEAAGHTCDRCPMADGGEGTLDGAGRRQSPQHGHRAARRTGRGRLAARSAPRRHRDGRGVGARAGRRTRGQRSGGRHHHGHRGADRRGHRDRGPSGARRRRRLGHHRRGAGGAARPVPVAAAAGHRAGRGLRRADAVRRRGRALRSPEGRHRGAGALPARPPRAPGRRLPGRARGRCARARGCGRGRRVGRGARCRRAPDSTPDSRSWPTRSSCSTGWSTPTW